jgi:type VI secretion system secreted protein VgrG
MSNPPLEIDPTPILPSSFLSLTDKRVVGQAVQFTEVYQISVPPPLPEAQPTPSVAMIRLREAPQQLSTNLNVNVLIPGFSEVISTPSTGQFLVNYGNGDIYFNTSQIGTDVVVTYYGTGSIITAADINNITGPLTPFYNKLDGIVPDLPAPQIFTFAGGIAGLMQRTTVISAANQLVFNAGFPVTPSSTLVYSQGLLMTAGISADYVTGGTGTFGTSISAFPLTILSGGTISINLNGDGVRTITLGADATGAAVAADIQAKIRALTANVGGNQPAYNTFTTTYSNDTGLYTLTSGTTGSSSSVVVTGASDAAKLLLGLTYGGIELIGSGSGSLTPGAANLASATGFAVLASSTITAAGTTTVNGNLGLYPGTSVTGTFIISGTSHVADSTAHLAQTSALSAYTDLQSRTGAINESGNVLGTGGTVPVLTGGGGTNVYQFTSSAQITGTLTLSGSATDVFIFQIGSTLTTAASSSVILSGGVLPQNVFWAVGSSATLGASSSLQGIVIAQASISVGASASTTGALLALTGAVTFAGTGNSVTDIVVGTAGTSVSAFPSTSLSGGTLILNIDGGAPHTITLGSDLSGSAVAADIQSQIRALFPLNPSYSGFVAAFNSLTGLYTLTSGTTGSSSSVVVTGGTDSLSLLLGVSKGGVELVGIPGTSQVIFNTPRYTGEIVNFIKIGV